MERLLRGLEKNLNHFKATELQSFLLFYGIPCLTGYLPDCYLDHFSKLSEEVYLLLGDSITREELEQASHLLDEFYRDFADLYGEGSCDLNVHNAGVHLVKYVKLWGPLLAWSCFPFEDLNCKMLETISGTGDMTKQLIRLHISNKRLKYVVYHLPDGRIKSYLTLLNIPSHSWSKLKDANSCSLAGALKSTSSFVPQEKIPWLLQRVEATKLDDTKVALKFYINGTKIYSEKYTRMKKSISYVVLLRGGKACKISYFVVNSIIGNVHAVIQYLEREQNTRLNGGHHLYSVKEGADTRRC